MPHSSCRFALLRCLAMLVVLAVPGAAGQSPRASIVGRVVERGTLTPIAGATLVLVATGMRTKADSVGGFTYTGLAPGVHRLVAMAVGYTVGEWNVRLDDGEELRYDFELDVLSYELTGVAVTGLQEFDRRRAKGIGYFFTAEEIERRHSSSLSDLMRGVPGVETSCARGSCVIRMSRGRCRPAYYLDGFPASFSVGPDFALVGIYGIEVYRSVSEAPAEFRKPELRCGVVLIWSRNRP